MTRFAVSSSPSALAGCLKIDFAAKARSHEESQIHAAAKLVKATIIPLQCGTSNEL
jgi:hypothetical protein